MKNDPQTVGILEVATQSLDIPELTGHVLVVDDTHDIRLLFAAFLRLIGVRASLAESGQIAYEKVMAAWKLGRPFDVVLMDIEMPVLDGITTTRRLRDAGCTGTIIMHTANTAIDRRKMCFEAGCDDYIEKPIRRDAFFALLSKYLQAGRPKSGKTGVTMP